MNISKQEQRVLHELALGGEIQYQRHDNKKIHKITCFTRDGYVMSNCTITLFTGLKNKRLISSKSSGPYRITRLGIKSVRAQMNQR